jgi:hypothetical protein
MDATTKRARRLAAHTKLATDRPLWELWGRPLVVPVVLAVVVGGAFWGVWLLVSASAGRLGSVVSDVGSALGGVTVPGRWLLVAFGVVLIVWGVRRWLDPGPRR